MSQKYTLLFLCIVCLACNSKHRISNTSDESDEIVLIFQNVPPDINYFRFPVGGIVGRGRHDISYMDNSMTLSRISLQKGSYSDTIRINTNNDIFELHHHFNFAESATFLFHRGDSVLFTYKQNIPHVTILNRETPFHESNYNIYIRKKVMVDELPAIFHHEFPLFFRGIPRDKNEEIAIRKQGINSIIKEWTREYQILDSLYNMGLPSYVYDHRRSVLISRIYSEYLNNSDLIQCPKIKKMLADTPLFPAKNDSLLQFAFYRRYLWSNIHRYIKDIEPIRVNSNGGGSQFPDYFARFDTISSLNFLSAKARRFFLMDELRMIFEVGSRNEIEKYSQKFIAITGDTSFVNQLLTDNKMIFCDSDQLLLIDRNNSQTNLQEVLDRNAGKFVYVSFWASWCAPCMRSMPYAKLLREEFQEKDVVFVYLAFNDDRGRWETAKQQAGLNDFAGSYFILNSRTAPMIADLNVRTLPRYLLFNRQGELVHSNAPGPQGEEIRELLNSLLKEN